MSKNIIWINSLKALCMFSVYLVHSEIYYGINTISYGRILQPFFVSAFFFVNGYLFFRKQLNTVANYKLVDFGKNLQIIISRLIIPTIIFASIIYLPKLFFHSKDLSITGYFYDVFGGISFWFTSALAVSQTILIALLILKKNNIWFYFICSVFLFIFALIISYIDRTPFPWFYKSGLGAILFITLGGLYQKYEYKIDNKAKSIPATLLIGLYLACMIYDIQYKEFLFILMDMTFNFQGLIISILGIVVITIICKQLPQLKLLEFIGKHSIVFYFFSGALPASIGFVFQKIFPDRLYIITLIVALLSICVGYLMTYIVVNFLPWLTDLRKLKK